MQQPEQALTERELHVLWLLVHRGFSNQQIADELQVTNAAVKFHQRNIRCKLGTHNRTETVAYAREHHILPEG